jgi:hypothetical protein
MKIINKKNLIPLLERSRLADEFEDEIVVPQKYVLTKIEINNNSDFYKTLDILRYWMVEELSIKICEYALVNNDLNLTNSTYDVNGQSINSCFTDYFFKELQFLINIKTKSQCLVYKSALHGHLNLLKCLYGIDIYWNTNACKSACSSAALNGHLDCLKYLYENGCPWSKKTCKNAALNGHLDCLKYLYENGCSYPNNIMHVVVKNDHVNCLKYLCENGISSNYINISSIASMGSLNCLKYVCEIKDELNNVGTVSAYNMYSVAANGHLDCLKYLHEIGCDWEPNTDETDEGYEYSFVCNAAALNGHLDCLKYAHENGCPWNESALGEAAQGGNIDCLKYVHLKMLEEATDDEKKDISYPWGSSGYACWMAVATDKDNLNCLKYAYENGCLMLSSTCMFAAKYNHLNSLKFAHENGASLNERQYHSASERHGIECFKYLHENGCPWAKKTCINAVVQGSIKCLKYAIENNCPFNKQTCLGKATMMNHTNIIEYLESISLKQHE